MKKIVLLFYLTGCILYSTLGQVSFQKRTNSILTCQGTTVYNDSGNIIVAGQIGNDLFIMKTNNGGNILWSYRYDSGFNDKVINIQKSDTGYLIFGQINYSLYNSDILVIKVDTSGNLKWAKAYSTLDRDLISSVGKTQNGFLIDAFSQDTIINSTRGLTINVDNDGNIISSFQSHHLNNIGHNITTRNNGSEIITIGLTNAGMINTGQRIFYMKTDTLGNIINSFYYQRDTLYWAIRMDAIIQTVDKGYILSGGIPTNDGFFYMKIDSLGNILWNKYYYNFVWFPYINSIIELHDSTFIMNGLYGSFNLTHDSNFLLHVNSNGNLIDAFTYQPIGSVMINNISTTLDSSIILCGISKVLTGGSNDLYLAKTKNIDSLCFISQMTISDSTLYFAKDTLEATISQINLSVTIPLISRTSFDSLMDICTMTAINELDALRSAVKIYPNPTHDFITIHYNLSSPNQTTLSLFNLYGQKLKTILNEKQPAGEHEIKTDMKDLEQGVYFVKMNVGGKEEVRKVVKY